MAAGGGAFATWIGGFFSAGGATTAVADTAATAATTAGVATAAGQGPQVAQAAVGVAGGVAGAGGSTAAGTGSSGLFGTGVTASEVSAAATGASAIYQLSQSHGGINLPPAPQTAIANDQQVQNTEQAQLRREQAAGGLQSTTGTPGGQAGSILNPATTSSKSLLGQ